MIILTPKGDKGLVLNRFSTKEQFEDWLENGGGVLQDRDVHGLDEEIPSEAAITEIVALRNEKTTAIKELRKIKERNKTQEKTLAKLIEQRKELNDELKVLRAERKRRLANND